MQDGLVLTADSPGVTITRPTAVSADRKVSTHITFQVASEKTVLDL